MEVFSLEVHRNLYNLDVGEFPPPIYSVLIGGNLGSEYLSEAGGGCCHASKACSGRGRSVIFSHSLLSPFLSPVAAAVAAVDGAAGLEAAEESGKEAAVVRSARVSYLSSRLVWKERRCFRAS